jgi:hypothetical protein
LKLNYYVLILLLSLSPTLKVEAISGIPVFIDWMQSTGWQSIIDPVKQLDGHTKQQTLQYVFRQPERDGYFPKIGMAILTYSKRIHIPKSNRKNLQVYTQENPFPIKRYRTLFPLVKNWPKLEHIFWRAVRHDNKVYITYAYFSRQDLDFYFQQLVNLFSMSREESADWLDNEIHYWQATYSNLTVAEWQIFLTKKLGLECPTDGMLDRDTIKAVQQYLSQLKIYKGNADGIGGPLTETAIQKRQKQLGVLQTGKLDATWLNKELSLINPRSTLRKE